MYDRFLEEAQAMGDAILSAHEIDVSFFRDKPNARGNIYYHTSEGTPFWQTSSPRLGLKPRELGWLRITRKHPLPYKLPYTDANSRSHRMVLALRCPTGAPEGLCSMFQNGAAVYDALRVSDETEEAKNGENFELTEPTYEIPYTNNSALSAPRTPRRRITKVGSTTGTSESASDVDMAQTVERKVGDTYPPSVLSDHRGPCFAHDKAVVTQRDYTDAEGNLIAPAELYSTLVEGTLVLVTSLLDGAQEIAAAAAYGAAQKKDDEDKDDQAGGDGEPTLKQKRGRSPKADKDDEPTPKRKRGRQSRPAVPAHPNAVPKKRGRPPKKGKQSAYTVCVKAHEIHKKCHGEYG
ncbi:hypothetical protein B0H14DRAFT_3771460 [Mycena olivaceomarginata]|nr:hypothetical protein B0H14DRAFT_3771460 [Mycena olivaceomarginata]